jgi:hypothetical protein
MKMPEPIDLTTVIEDSISDSVEPLEPVADSNPVEASGDTSVSDSTSTPVEGVDASTAVPDATVDPSEVPSPASRQPGAQEAVDPKLGVAAQINGRENRIPYSRVQKIVENAEKKATAPHLAKLAELEPKVKDYEEKLSKVAQFEQVMLNDAPKFLQMLAGVPAYRQFFQAIQELQNRQATPTGTPNGVPTGQSSDPDPMPEPDQPQADGSAVYSMDGLKNLLAWQKRQVTKEVASRYAPIEEQWQAQQRIQAAIPQVNAQINEARSWPQFTENEPDIVKALQTNPQLSLEGAYRQVVFPRLIADQTTMRQRILAEIQKAPTAPTSTTPRSVKPNATSQSTGPRSLEDIIKEQVQQIGGGR